MQLVRYGRETRGWAVSTDDGLFAVPELTDERMALSKLTNESYRAQLAESVERGSLPRLNEGDVQRLAPVQNPGQIVCVGLNYYDHAEEQNEEIPDEPLLFAKSPTCVTNPGNPVVHPSDIEEVDYEVELAIVIGMTAWNVPAEDAEEYVAGYTVLNDVSARDAQFADGQFFRGKSYRTFAPQGPTLVTPDAIDPNDCRVELRVNGDPKQVSSTSEFIFDVGDVIEYISGVTTLEVGDVISTGTPGGVGIFRDPPELLEPGDTVEAEIEGIGTLQNPVVAEE